MGLGSNEDLTFLLMEMVGVRGLREEGREEGGKVR